MSVNSVNNTDPIIPQDNSKKPEGVKSKTKSRLSQNLTQKIQKELKAKEKQPFKPGAIVNSRDLPAKATESGKKATKVFQRGTFETEIYINPMHKIEFTKSNAVETVEGFFKLTESTKIAGKILKVLANNKSNNFELLYHTLENFYIKKENQKEKPRFYEVLAILAGFDDKDELCRKLVAKLASRIQTVGLEGDSKDLIKVIYAKYQKSPSLYPIIYSFTQIDLVEEKADDSLLRNFSISNALTKALTQDLISKTSIKSQVEDALKKATDFNLKSKEGIEKYSELITSITTECFCLGDDKNYKKFLQKRKEIIESHFNNKISSRFTINSDLFFYGLAPIISEVPYLQDNEFQAALMKNLRTFFKQTALDEMFKPDQEISCLNKSLEVEIYFLKRHFHE